MIGNEYFRYEKMSAFLFEELDSFSPNWYYLSAHDKDQEAILFRVWNFCILMTRFCDLCDCEPDDDCLISIVIRHICSYLRGNYSA